MKKSASILLLSLFFWITGCGGERSSESATKHENDSLQMEERSAGVQQNNSPKIKPGHIVMMVSDLDQSQQFYEEHLDFHTNEEVVYEGLRRIFMSASDSHHELVLLESRVAEFPHKDERQLQQVAFELSSHDVLVDYYQHIKETDIPYVIKDNQVSLSLYFPDPDGVTVELYWDITEEPFGEKKWGGNQEDISEAAFLNPYEEMEK
ncbi:VOC family protein [Marivirga sp. S37H4]|uniref:VOC family protein n=1 Tax=Marivirga aurantiaca TaxID=2802615 RepID=A0A934X177_9BACT|nr:VOC family protein [Marivirga aurantiaca]MBK6267083.1 VOC family protein [Marivirga aurantiaca]